MDIVRATALPCLPMKSSSSMRRLLVPSLNLISFQAGQQRLNYSSNFLKPKQEETVYKADLTKKFGRKQLFADFIARQMTQSSLVLIARGKPMLAGDELKRNKAFKKLGFAHTRLPSSGLKAAVRYCTVADENNIVNAEKYSHGQLQLLMWREPVLKFVLSNTLKDLEKTLSSFAPFQVKSGPMNIVACFMMDRSKENPFVWMDNIELKKFVEEANKLWTQAGLKPEDISAFPPHAMYHIELNRTLESSLSSIVRPLEQPLNSLTSTMQKPLDSVNLIFSQVADKKQAQDSP